MAQPRGPITTLLDLTDRDLAENDLYPLDTNTTWFTRDPDRATVTFTPQIQTIQYRGPASWGQRFTIDLGSLQVGDLLYGTMLQMDLGHWLDRTTLLNLAAGQAAYADPQTAWEYANALGLCAVAQAELEINGVTVETLDGDFMNVFSLLWGDLNTQVGTYDSVGKLPIAMLRQIAAPQGSPPRQTPLLIPAPRTYSTEDGIIHCPLPFFFMRTSYQEALPMIAIKEGSVRIHVTLRPFTEVVRQIRGFRDSCDATPLGQSFTFTGPAGGTATAAVVAPEPNHVRLLALGALMDGSPRQDMLRKPFEMLHREVQTFVFTEPLKYATAKRGEADVITVQLPLEANHPVEEILWFVRRKETAANNEWTNYSDRVEQEWPLHLEDPIGVRSSFVARPMLVAARFQANGQTLVEAEEQYFRQQAARAHRGGWVAYTSFLYGYSFAERPGAFQPSGSINASRVSSLRLTLDVRPPGGALDGAWEVKVFCVALNWLRFENGLANAVFED
jgi:hypothetical protein